MILTLALLFSQAGGPEAVHLADRTELRGVLESVSTGAGLRIRLGTGGHRDVAWEDLVRIRFPEPAGEAEVPRGGEQLLLGDGGLVMGRLESFDDGGVVWTAAWGRLALRPDQVRSLLLGPVTGPVPETPAGKGDVVVREVERREEGRAQPVKEMAVDAGRLVSVGPGLVSFETVEAGRKDHPRATVRRIYLRRGEGLDAPAPGLYARVRLRDGSRWTGMLTGVAPSSVRIFSPVLGSVELPRARIHSVAFVQHGRAAEGNLLVAESTGVREFDRKGSELWRYRDGPRMARSARRLENGNVLIVQPQHGTVIEVRPRGKAEGDVVWSLTEAQYPFDAVRLPGGTTVVAEHYGSRVAEYDAAGRMLRAFEIQTPQALERLENGRLLVTTPSQVLELDAAWKVVWRANLKGQLRPSRAERLENGNTLIADSQRGLLVELDPQSNEVWRQTGLNRPLQTARLEDGSTLILEEGGSRIVEVDPWLQQGPQVVVKGLQGGAGFSVR